MPDDFRDHVRKRIVREKWNTPLLEWLAREWRCKYFYFGLPGPQVYDIRLWQQMIRRVVAFELEKESGTDRRENIAELSRNLEMLGMPYSVYCGPIEQVVIEGEDNDGKQLDVSEFVTLFNLDFCGAITGNIPTQSGDRPMRFEALRQILTIQRGLFRKTRNARFVLLLTLRDEFSVSVMRKFTVNRDLPAETKQRLERIIGKHPLPNESYARNSELLGAFVFSFLREYLHGHRVRSIFLPVLAYVGKTARSPMLHFVVVCEMQNEEEAMVADNQTAKDFFALPMIRANDSSLSFERGSPSASQEPIDPVVYTKKFVCPAGHSKGSERKGLPTKPLLGGLGVKPTPTSDRFKG